MKALVIILIAFVTCAQSLNDEEKEFLLQHKTNCVATSGVDEENIRKLRANEEISDNALQEYVGCMFTNLELISPAGELQEDVIVESIPSDYNRLEALKIINECKHSKGRNADETAFIAYKCFLKSTSQLILDVDD